MRLGSRFAAFGIPAGLRQPFMQGANPQPARPGATTTPYQIGGEIGAGRCAVVYKALRSGSSTPIALKRLLPDDALRETQANARLQGSRWIAPLIGPSVPIDGYVYLPYPLFEAELKNLNPGRFLPAAFASLALIPVAKLCRDCETRGVVLTDLNPRNLMMRYEGKLLIVQAIDLGSMVMPGSAGATVVEFTESWMAPELGIPSVHTNTLSWAFGAMARWAAGLRWFDVDVHEGAILAGASWLGPRLASLVASCTAAFPERRPSPMEIVSQLSRILRDSSGIQCRSGHACFASATSCSCGRRIR